MFESSRLLRYIFVGVSSAAILGIGISVLVELVGLKVTLASTISCIVAVYYNYLMHYHWTFETDAPHGLVLMKYLAMCMVGFFLNGLIMYFGMKFTEDHYLVIQTFGGFAMAFWNFFASYFWVFNKLPAQSHNSTG